MEARCGLPVKKINGTTDFADGTARIKENIYREDAERKGYNGDRFWISSIITRRIVK